MTSSTSHQFHLSDKHDFLSERLGGRAKTSMLGFTKKMNPDFRINWHHAVTCAHLDRFVNGEIPRLMIFVEPQTGKSELVSRHLPAYIFGKDPNHKLIAATYGDEFSSLFNLDVQRIIDSPKYREVFPETMLSGHGEAGHWVRNSSTFDIVNHKGRYNSVGVGGSLTGKTGNTLIIDDPVKNYEEAKSQLFQERQFNWYSTVARTRLKPDFKGNPPRILLTMTRWDPNDLAAKLLKIAKDHPNLPQWTVLRFPAIREDMNDPLDPRALGDPLWPYNRSLGELQEIKATNMRGFESLYQQNPTPLEGNLVKRAWWKTWTELPEQFDAVIQSWDLTFKKSKTSDWVVGQVWGKHKANRYLLHQVRAKMSFKEQLAAIEAVSKLYPDATAKYIEQAANAEAAYEMLHDEVSGLILIPAKTSKRIRCEIVAPSIQSGNVFLPPESIAPWRPEFIEEWAKFSGVDTDTDDQVDAGTQALIQLNNATPTDWAPSSIKKTSIWNKK